MKSENESWHTCAQPLWSQSSNCVSHLSCQPVKRVHFIESSTESSEIAHQILLGLAINSWKLFKREKNYKPTTKAWSLDADKNNQKHFFNTVWKDVSS